MPPDDPTPAITASGKNPADVGRRAARYWRIAWLAIALMVFVLALRLITDFDLGFHLRGGQWLIQHRTFHRLDVFTYTVPHHEYVAMYWLFQIIVYLVLAVANYPALSFLTAFLIVVAFGLLWLRLQLSRVPPAWSAALLLTAAFAMEVRFALRPELLTWIYLLLILIVLDGLIEGRHRQCWWLPIIQLFWTNSHGLFVLGWFVIMAYLTSGWFHRRQLDRQFLAWSAAAVLTSLVNPYFLKGISFPFYLLTRLQPASVFKNIISEFRSPWSIRPTLNAPFFPSAPIYLFYLTVVLSGLGLLITFKKRRLHDFLLWLGFLFIASAAVRNVPFFIIIAVPIIGVCGRDLYQNIKPRLPRFGHGRIPAAVMPAAFSLIALLLGLRVITNAYYVADRRKLEFGAGLDRNAQGSSAAEFIQKHRLNGKILNDLNRGGWFIWTLPQPVYIDGRLEVIKEDLFQEYLESFQPGGLNRLIEKYQPDLIAFDYLPSIEWHYQLRRLPGWRLVYWDQSSAVWLVDGYAPQLAGIELTAALAQMGIDTTLTKDEVDRLLRQPAASRFNRWLSGFYRRQPFPYELTKMGIFAYKNGYYRIAELCFLEFLRKTGGALYEVYTNLGAVYFWSGDYDRARYCYERVLKESPRNRLARNRLAEIRRKIK